MSNQETTLPDAPSIDSRRVYQLNHEGVEFELFSDGVLTARLRKLDDRPTVVALWLNENGNPSIPKHKNFNSLVKWGVRDGDFDDFYDRKADHERRMKYMRKSAPEMLEALQGLLSIVRESQGVAGWHMNGDIADWDEFDDIAIAESVVAKATGADHE